MAVILNPRKIDGEASEASSEERALDETSPGHAAILEAARTDIEFPIKFVPAFDLLEQKEKRAGCSKEDILTIAGALVETLSGSKHQLDSAWILESRRFGLR